jgi:molybdenum ABC transporter molybdate-binding protein
MQFRRSRWNTPWAAFLGSAILLGFLIAVLAWDSDKWWGRRAKIQPLLVYCAAGVKKPVEEAALAYEREYGVPVDLQYGASQTLLAGIELSNKGDLYIPADESYVQLAQEKGLVEKVLALARMRPVLVVRKGNNKAPRSLAEVLSRPTRVGLANPQTAAIGKVTEKALKKTGQWKRIQELTVVYKPTVTDIAVDVQLGAVDAAFVWDVLVRQLDGLQVIPAPPLEGVISNLGVALLRCSQQPTAALRFARFLAARDRGLLFFKENDFEPVDGDRWDETSTLRLFGKAMLASKRGSRQHYEGLGFNWTPE